MLPPPKCKPTSQRKVNIPGSNLGRGIFLGEILPSTSRVIHLIDDTHASPNEVVVFEVPEAHPALPSVPVDVVFRYCDLVIHTADVRLVHKDGQRAWFLLSWVLRRQELGDVR